MSEVFVDSFYCLALLNARDAAHKRAVRFSATARVRMVTTGFVLTEVADALCDRSQRRNVVHLLDTVRADPYYVMVPASQELLDRGLDLYRRRPDKDWSLTDCISFVVMRERGITEALTADHHFQQAGFMALLR
ncbi:type II toxin-antitoxin system VapC family toxin [bacterium]|nr:type II toxin-antitoxin system VapC family toxin [bacterium]